MGTKKKKQAYPCLATSGGVRVDESSASCPGGVSPRRKRRAVHSKKLLKGKLLSFPLHAIDYRPPPFLRDAPTLAPLLGGPMSDSQVVGHFRDGIPTLNNLGYGLDHSFSGHDCDNGPDSQSGQHRTSRSVTRAHPKRTMCPMGKATTPTSFKVMFCQRVKSARTMTGQSQAEVAAELGISADTYSKYERRSLPPHYLIPRLCDVLDIDESFLFSGGRKKKAAGSDLHA